MILVAKAVITKNEKILLLKRSLLSNFFPDMWDLPGGKIEVGESPDRSVMRETKEETGLVIKPGRLIAEYDLIENTKPIHFWIFSVNSFTTNIKLSCDHTAFHWFSKDELQKQDVTPLVKLHFNNH